ncbi:hypothetical protein [Halobacillus litoralis]|uniref:Uncharacterized protein n=1 Tax=Halobacillus litoralis TaxID=45668 RepID=A0A410MJB8_9BACI|nr:hypothetical protein [Halobacillus litoralis]QAS54790.1 hypothetical protein HLI_21280 [Halobacillus litoralis]
MRSMPEFEHQSWLNAIQGLKIHKLFRQVGVNVTGDIYIPVDAIHNMSDLVIDGFSKTYSRGELWSCFEEDKTIKEKKLAIDEAFIEQTSETFEYFFVIEDERFNINGIESEIPLKTSFDDSVFEGGIIVPLQFLGYSNPGIAIGHDFFLGSAEVVEEVFQLESLIKQLHSFPESKVKSS